MLKKKIFIAATYIDLLLISDRLNLFTFPSLYIKYTFLHKTLLLNEKNTTNVYMYYSA